MEYMKRSEVNDMMKRRVILLLAALLAVCTSTAQAALKIDTAFIENENSRIVSMLMANAVQGEEAPT